ncbi:MAG: hypothetical protein EP344_17900 [Bacteroidetes bacterium]|nr:MAG: hypothetical protein EP344_17900 [Bacteroidota bacterium]
MSKKKFSEGLDDLFKDLPAEDDAWGHASDTPVRERKASSKNFMHDLDELFHQALDEPEMPEQAPPAAATPSTKSKASPSYRAPMSGLDSLIRQTIDVREIQSDEAGGKKRLTVAINREKLQQLKTIARIEHAYLKDIVLQVIDEYIEKYTQEKGIDLE